MTRDLTIGTPWKLLLSFGLPLFIGNVFQQAYNLVDTMIVGKYLGALALAGVGVASPVFNLICALLIGLSVGSSIMVSQLFGARKEKELPVALSTILIVSVGVALALSLAGQLLVEPMLKLMDTPAEDLPYAVTYLRVIILGLVFNVLYNQLSGLLRGLGNSKVPLYFLVLASVLNVVLDLLFVAVFHWGVAGAAVATILSQAISAALTWVYIVRCVPEFRREAGMPLVRTKLIGQMVRFGLPMALQHCSVSLGHILLQGFVNSFGTSVIGAFTAGSKIDLFVLMPTTSIASALATFSAQNTGAGKPERLNQGLKAASIMGVVISLALGAAVLLNRYALVSLFLSENEFPELAAEMITAGAEMLSILPWFYATQVFSFMCQNVISGAGRPTFAMLVGIGMMVIRLALVWFFINVVEIGRLGLWWSFPTSWAVMCAVVVIYYLRGTWKRGIFPEPEKAER